MEQFELDSNEWSELVDRLGGNAALAGSARDAHAFARARGVKTASDLLRLAFMYGPGGHSLRSLAASAAARGLADVSDVAMLKRLRRAGDWLHGLCEARLAQAAHWPGAQKPGAAPGRPIRIVDGSLIAGPGDDVWRLHLCYDPGLGRIAQAALTTTKKGERLDRVAVTPGEIRLGDRGYPQPDGIANTLGAKADVLVRLTWNSVKLTGLDDKPIDWLDLFKTAGAQGSRDMPVRLHKTRGPFKPIVMRLVIIAKPPAAALAARAKAQHASRKHQRKRTDPRTLAGAGHVILLTSLSAQDFPLEQLGALYRLRWQIELAIKRLKSILHIDRLPAKDPGLARAWLLAHLLLALLLDETLSQWSAIPP